jgi:hypothetical protein
MYLQTLNEGQMKISPINYSNVDSLKLVWFEWISSAKLSKKLESNVVLKFLINNIQGASGKRGKFYFFVSISVSASWVAYQKKLFL